MGGLVPDPRIERRAGGRIAAALAGAALVCDLATWCLLAAASVALFWGRPPRNGPRQVYFYYGNLNFAFLIAALFYYASSLSRWIGRLATGTAAPDDRGARWLRRILVWIFIMWTFLLGLSLPSQIDIRAAFAAATLALVNPLALVLISVEFCHRALRRRHDPA